ncbi:hypothetical protein COLO4_27135 [Corchorus olitorius]|uniref:Uncharacterized protein n=1 Tax=Corchorus olitorius TaxID=93759 RepID=A0A1R3HT43_9ROSI|nr:hypothetical protein COLO4_27135 [Corchorus olitorius]
MVTFFTLFAFRFLIKLAASTLKARFGLVTRPRKSKSRSF